MRIAIFSLDPIMGEGLASLLSHTGGFDVVACLANVDSAILLANSNQVDLLLFTEHFNTESYKEAIGRIRYNSRVTTMLVTNSVNDNCVPNDVFDLTISTLAGVSALCQVIRNCESHVDPIGQVLQAAPQPNVSSSDFHFHRELTARERETADLIAQGHNNKQIASLLGISEPTAKLYVGKLLRLLKCQNRVQLALKLRELKGNTYSSDLIP